MKNSSKLIIWNLAFLLLIFIFFELICGYLISQFFHYRYDAKTIFQKISVMLETVAWGYREYDFSGKISYDFREPIIGTGKKSIILSGCSFTYGLGLESDENFSGQLAKYLKKYSVYNIGVNGASPREALYLLRNYEDYKYLFPKDRLNTKYFIYTYIDDHHRRLLKIIDLNSPFYRKYKKEDGSYGLEQYIPLGFYRKTAIFRYIDLCRKVKVDKELNNLFTLYMSEMQAEVKNLFPNAEFVVFCYLINDKFNYDWKELEKRGIRVVKLRDFKHSSFQDEKYAVSDKWHPNGRAWKEIVPLLAEELNM